MIKDFVLKNRSYRRFYQDSTVEMDTLKELVDLARISSSGGNKQPLKYILSCDPETNATIFDQLGWAAALKDWPGPEEGERPTAYVVVLEDTTIGKAGVDHGITCTNMLLGAVEKGLGGCMLATVRKKELRQALSIDDIYEILLVVALGKPKEIVKLDVLESGGDTRYWRDEDQVHHVPKRKLEDIVVQAYA
jgi:nitroreductase